MESQSGIQDFCDFEKKVSKMRVLIVFLIGVLMTCLAESHSLRSSSKSKTLSKQDDKFKAFRERYVVSSPKCRSFDRSTENDPTCLNTHSNGTLHKHTLKC